ncbi:hypothetical protein N7491_010321 [Penicillium cf. griseofulvum]|uniref:Azaphilone pigments biosynthesis cluster protein L N-terminal domain-containing protein n=1 Tax=Penicillium cf. griseofulvum TaxID=2972120 RepID=A0A9W9T5Q4_9EURO|nr:hypothetical protein N7472_000653 [Penicillium cf. griseofulvum]KAJ5421876.1 hypothetical protein N7491_010321 [Penicillium cf. griseofulvum]KAJ5428067.1 hypothetical protein N7445_009521 [Penicillium cf. griseofulvum]
MAEPIGIASGLVALATFAFQSSIALFDSVQSYQSHPKRVRDLIEELETLNGVLGALKETVDANTDINLSSLGYPLLRCGNACKDFEEELKKCSTRSSAGKTSFRDWAKLKYMGEDIDGFRRMLAGYKSTIIIALTDANLRQSSIAADSLESYKEMIETTTDDLEIHLEGIDEKLEKIIAKNARDSNTDAGEIQLMEEERLSTQKCLEICAQLSSHIDQIQQLPKTRDHSTESVSSSSVPERVTNEGLQECKNSLSNTAAKLENHLKILMNRIVTNSKTSTASQEDIAELLRLQEEWETTRQCMHICSKAGTHLNETASTIDNYATGDAVQFMVSTNEKIIHGRNRGLGWRTRQVGGHLSDASLQQLSKDMNRVNFANADHWGSPSAGQDEGLEDKPLSEFKDRYGRGFKLTTERSAPKVSSTTPPRGDQ